MISAISKIQSQNIIKTQKTGINNQPTISSTVNQPQLIPVNSKYLSSIGVIHFGSSQKSLPLPPRDDSVVDDFSGTNVADPYRPLENLDTPETKNWWKAQNERTETYLSKVDDIRAESRKWHENIRNYTKESMKQQYGDNYFFTRKEGLAPQESYYVSKGAKDAEPQILIDPNKLSEDGTVALKTQDPSPDGKIVAYTVSEAGSDWQTMRFRNVETGEDSADELKGLRFTEATWDTDGKGVVYNKPTTEDNSVANDIAVYHHTLGEDQSKDVKIYGRPDVENSFVAASRIEKDDDVLFAHVYSGTNPETGFYFQGPCETEMKEIIPPNVAKVSPFYRDKDTVYATTDLDAPRSKFVAIDLKNPKPENWKTILPESDDPSNKLNYGFVAGGKLFAKWSKGGADALEVLDLDGKHINDVDIPLGSTIIMGQVTPKDKEFEMSIGGFLSPGTRYKYNVEDNKLEFVKKSNISRDLTDKAEVERIYAKSKDGTKVPMWVIKPKDMKKDGKNATQLYGYGGFNIALEPEFDFDIMQWVENGGVYAIANLRGGGEFGKDWYDGGRLKNKQNVFDDFAACADKLVEDKYTKPERLAIYGASNGGLLTAVTSQQYPDKFGAAISEVPVADMLRFQTNNYGAAWMSDYGDPSKKEDFDASIKYSPLHNVENADKVKYPPTLIMTGDHDDRVGPWHSFKWAATRQEKGQNDNTYLRVEERAGHGAGKPTKKVIDNSTDRYAFLVENLGPLKSVDEK